MSEKIAFEFISSLSFSYPGKHEFLFLRLSRSLWCPLRSPIPLSPAALSLTDWKVFLFFLRPPFSMAKRWSMNNYSSCCRCCREVFPLPQKNFGIKNWLRRYKFLSLYSNFSSLVNSTVLKTKFSLVPPQHACTPRFPLEEEKEDVTDFKLSIILFSAPNAAARRSVAYIMSVLGCKIFPQCIRSDLKLF